MTSEETTPSVREEVRTVSQEDFAKARTKAQLVELATALNLELDPKATKAEITAAIYGHYPLPDPSLRGNSAIESPVAFVWQHAENRFRDAEAEGQPKPRRKDIVNECVEAGVAYYTARTQYQAWYAATDKGTKPLASLSDLPKSVDAMLNPTPVAEDAA